MPSGKMDMLKFSKFNKIMGHYDFSGHRAVIMGLTGILLITHTDSCWDVIYVGGESAIEHL